MSIQKESKGYRLSIKHLIAILCKIAGKRPVHEILHKYHEIYGETYQIRIGPKKIIVNLNPKLTEAIVNNPKFGKSDQYDMMEQWLGENLVTSNGEAWHKMRKLITPAFHFQILERFIPIFEEKVEIMTEKITKQGSNTIDVFEMLQNLTFDIISDTSMGVNLNAQMDSTSPFILANQKMVEIVTQRAFNGFLAVDWIFRLTPYYKVHKECVELINKFVDDVIQERRKTFHYTKHTNNKDDDLPKHRPALLDILLRAQIEGNSLFNERIRSEVQAFMFAGNETTANSLSFTLYLIAKYAEVQEKLFNEIKLNGLHEPTISLKIRDLNALSYMDNVIKESLRLFPALFLAVKWCEEDIKIGDVFIPKYTSFGTSIFSGHRSAKYFTKPNKFNPDRFDAELTAEDRNPYIYQPFSSGLRNCIGQRFAMLEMKTVLVKLLSTFEIKLADNDFEVDVICTFSLKPSNGIPLIFKKRF
uniref:CSON009392 protein n=1 Tax=Culicoides sonorensis TaxID=179676 RepID=A0A336M080_CULSO